MPLGISMSVSGWSGMGRCQKFLAYRQFHSSWPVSSQTYTPADITPWLRRKNGYSCPDRRRSGTVKVNQQVSVQNGSSLRGRVELVVGGGDLARGRRDVVGDGAAGRVVVHASISSSRWSRQAAAGFSSQIV